MSSSTPAIHHTSAVSLRLASRRLARGCTMLIAGLPVAVVILYAVADDATLAAQVGLYSTSLRAPLSLWQRLLAGALSVLVVLALVRAVTYARRCLHLVAEGDIFALQVVQNLRKVAWWGCLWSLASFIARPILSVLMTLQNPPGSRMLTLGIEGDQIVALFFAGLVWVVASVIAEAHAIARENSQFV
jgi:hypothetical protein